MPAIETAAMPGVAGMARSYGPAATTRLAPAFDDLFTFINLDELIKSLFSPQRTHRNNREMF
jgi:hypothetical protein